jgi:1L-myo-inositol 1-phosphate cytidylyltransferase / CDP-L-myo-inositol myo-inositolphosphotransferase
MSAIYDGYVSRYINRRISDPIAKCLSKTGITPNQISWTAFGLAILSLVSFICSWNIAGGLLAQLSSIIDGADGSLARLKGMSSEFGGFLDSVLDRYADICIILGLTIWSAFVEAYPYVWLVGFMAIAGIMGISYSRARIDVEFRQYFDRGFLSLASRDIRLFIVMIGAIIGQGYYCLIVIASLTHIIVISRLVVAYIRLRQK